MSLGESRSAITLLLCWTCFGSGSEPCLAGEAVEGMLELKLERNLVGHERACLAMSIWKHRPGGVHNRDCQALTSVLLSDRQA